MPVLTQYNEMLCWYNVFACFISAVYVLPYVQKIGNVCLRFVVVFSGVSYVLRGWHTVVLLTCAYRRIFHSIAQIRSKFLALALSSDIVAVSFQSAF